MPGKFLTSTSGNFIRLKNGLESSFLSAVDSHKSLIENTALNKVGDLNPLNKNVDPNNQYGNICKINNDDLNTNVRKIISKLEAMSRIITSLISILTKLLKFLTFIKSIIIAFTVLSKLLKALPIPNMFTTAGVVVTFGDLLNKIQDKLFGALLIIEGISIIINFIQLILVGLLEQISFFLSQLSFLVASLEACANQKNNISENEKNSKLLLANDLRSSLNNLNANKGDLESLLGSLSRSNNSYKGFTFVVLEEETVTEVIAKRRYAIALNANGVEVLQGSLTYASDEQVLIDELKLLIDKDNLTGYTSTSSTSSPSGTSAVPVSGTSNLTTSNTDGKDLQPNNLGDLYSTVEDPKVLDEYDLPTTEEIKSDEDNAKSELDKFIKEKPFNKLRKKLKRSDKRFIKRLTKKSQKGVSVATNILNRYNSNKINISDAKKEWQEYLTNKISINI